MADFHVNWFRDGTRVSGGEDFGEASFFANTLAAGRERERESSDADRESLRRLFGGGCGHTAPAGGFGGAPFLPIGTDVIWMRKCRGLVHMARDSGWIPQTMCR